MKTAPALLTALALAIALTTGGRLLAWQAERVPEAGSVFDLLLGESRRAFAMHAFIKADAYFHSGFYPSVFDLAQQLGHIHRVAGADRELRCGLPQANLGQHSRGRGRDRGRSGAGGRGVAHR